MPQDLLTAAAIEELIDRRANDAGIALLPMT
jgi:hypothetical protein